MSNLYIGLGGVGIDAAKAVCEKACTEGSNQCNNSYVLIDTDFGSKNCIPDSLQRSFIDIGDQFLKN